jgi:hypothetical protein
MLCPVGAAVWVGDVVWVGEVVWVGAVVWANAADALVADTKPMDSSAMTHRIGLSRIDGPTMQASLSPVTRH